MERIPRGVYTQEFREQAVELKKKEEVTLSETARRLSMPKGTLRNWVEASAKGQLKEVGKHQKPLTEPEVELTRIKRELAEVKMERDLLKKAAAYFAKESR